MKKLVLSVAVIATMGLASCGGASLCDCVNMDEPSEECKKMEEDYKAKMKDATYEETFNDLVKNKHSIIKAYSNEVAFFCVII